MPHGVSVDLSGRVALVTGGGVGLGAAIAELLGRAGAFVGVHYHSSRAGAEEVVSAVRAAASAGKSAGDGVALQGDLTLEADANRIVDELVARAGRLDFVINNAGALVGRAKIEDTTLDLWNRTLAANLTSAFLVTRRAIPHLRKAAVVSPSGAVQRTSSVVNIISLSTQTGGANGAGAYAAAKGGMAVFTRTLAKELAPHVRTNSICPGVIETRHHEVASSAEAMENYRKQTPLARNGQAGEVAAATLHLCSEGAGFTNGALLDINGGRFLR